MNLNDYVGLPFVERGRTRAGVDCWGLLRLVYADRLRIVLPSFGDAYTLEDAEALAALIEGGKGPWVEIPAGNERPGDGVLMTLDGLARHVGVVGPRGYILHIERGTGSLMERADGARLKRRIVGYFRHESLV